MMTRRAKALRLIGRTCLLCLSAAAAGCSAATPAGHPIRAVTVSNVTTTITINPQVGMVFAPPPARAAPKLTAEQAWADWAVPQGWNAALPSRATVHLGLLTLPIGPNGPNGTETYTAYKELAYGFSTHACPKSRNPRVTSLPPNPCIYWDFVDANTGKQIDSTYQM